MIHDGVAAVDDAGIVPPLIEHAQVDPQHRRIIDAPGYRLYMQLGVSYQCFQRMRDNQVRSISLKNIDALRQIFGCTPNDLFLFTDGTA